MTCQITYQHIQRTRPVEPGCSLLAAFKLHNVPIAYSCENATCGTCVVRIIEGQERLTPMSREEADALCQHGYEGISDPATRLACQAMISSHGAMTVKNKVV